MAPRKKSKNTAPEMTFSAPKTGVPIPKNNAPKGVFYRAVEALKVDEMIEIGNTNINDAKSIARKVGKEHADRKFEIRLLNSDNPESPVGVWRMA